jgi:hypothetical protein
MNSDADEGNLDIKKNFGLQYYQFETHMRQYLLDLVEPTIKKGQEDHNIVL